MVRPRAFRQIDPVMTFPEDKSPYGVFDMAGNVQEWTKDLFDPRYYHRCLRQDDRRQPDRADASASPAYRSTWFEGGPRTGP